MNEPGSFIWTWYGQDEHRWVLLSAEAFLALDFLALDGAMQRETIGSCPGCSTWSEKVVPLHEWLEGCPGRQAGSFRDALRRVWALCNELPEEALGCFDFDIYAHPGWQAVRREAWEALRQNGWDSIRSHAEELRDDCWERVHGYPKK